MRSGPPVADTVVAVLCGGRSRRMGGRAKATLILAETTVLDRILTSTASLEVPRILVGAHQDLDEDPELAAQLAATGLPLARDRQSDSGPLAGLDAAFAATGARRVLLLACDLPFLTPAFLAWILEQGQQGSVVPVDGNDRLHPLCAVYDEACRADLTVALDARRLRLQDFVRTVGARRLSPGSWAGFDPHGRLLTNLNEPADYEAAQRWFCDGGEDSELKRCAGAPHVRFGR